MTPDPLPDTVYGHQNAHRKRCYADIYCTVRTITSVAATQRGDVEMGETSVHTECKVIPVDATSHLLR